MKATRSSAVYFCPTRKDHDSFCFLVQIQERRDGERPGYMVLELYPDKVFKKAHTSQPSCEAVKQITLCRGLPLVLDTMRGCLFALFLL